MSEAREPGEDRYDRLEREHEERQKAARDLAGLLGVGSEASTEAPASPEERPEERGEARRDEQGRFKRSSADAGEHGAPVLPTPSMGAMIMALIDNDPSYVWDEVSQ